MSTPADEVTIDLDAAEAEAKKAAEGAAKTANGKDTTEITVETAPETVKQPEKKIVTPEEGLAKLQKELDEERTARRAAEARASAAAQGEAQARGEVQVSQLDQVKGAIEQAKQQGDLLQSQYEAALTAQDWAGAAKAQRELAKTEARLVALEAGKTQLERAPKPTPRAVSDPVEAYIASANIDTKFPRSAQWLRAHPDWVIDERKQRRMIRAHEDALDEGHIPESDSYFRYVEDRLGLSQVAQTGTEEKDDDPMKDAAKPATPKTPAAAPVSRGGNGNGSTHSRKITLTADEAEMARLSFPDSKDPYRDYAMQQQALRKEGKLN
jgi:hypothetical protein